jgi:hypothetical protein
MRKVNATVDVTIMVPVKAKVEVRVDANEGTDITRAVNHALKGSKLHGGADVHVLRVEVEDDGERIHNLCAENVENQTGVEVGNINITDSR